MSGIYDRGTAPYTPLLDVGIVDMEVVPMVEPVVEVRL